MGVEQSIAQTTICVPHYRFNSTAFLMFHSLEHDMGFWFACAQRCIVVTFNHVTEHLSKWEHRVMYNNVHCVVLQRTSRGLRISCRDTPSWQP